jgi:hypothetical protein
MKVSAIAGACLSLAAFAGAAGPDRVLAADAGCQQSFSSTYDMVQQVVFDRHGCTSAACHSGAAPAGGLDLSAGVSYGNLVDQSPQSIPTELYPGLARVVPGSKTNSLLWLNVAAATLPDQWRAPLRPMPQGGLPPLTTDELQLVQLWIEGGAPLDGVVPGTAALFNACLPPPEPIMVKPLGPPAPGVGLQLRAPHQVLPPKSEREVCFVSYYDVTDQVPAEFRGPNGDTFRYKRIDARQDPISHHAVVNVYQGKAAIDDPAWGPFACRGGSRDGQSCEPTDLTSCGGDGVCASAPFPTVACIGYGPGDASIGTGTQSLFTSMGTSISGRDGIFAEAPLRGILVWDSHAFNVTDQPAPLDIWINFDFAAPAEQVWPLQRFVDVSAIAAMHVPAFGAEEVCNRHVMPDRAGVLDLFSHTHKRGKRFRVFDGDFSCVGGPHAGGACDPLAPDPGFPMADPCAGAACQSHNVPAAGDCDGNGVISIDELVLGVDIALGRMPVSACAAFDANHDGAVAIDELLASIHSELNPLRDAQASLLYTSLTYADPLVLELNPPLQMAPPGAADAARTLTYCALYDNGFTNPNEVKRNSTVPTNGAPCQPTNCAEGDVGAACSVNAQCDSSPGSGDGACDACAVGFGVTTDDEMFVLAGSYIQQ